MGAFFRVKLDDGFPEFTEWGMSKEELHRYLASQGYKVSHINALA